jgi:peptidoglycan/LPS O-acetylase OafA/YrhL
MNKAASQFVDAARWMAALVVVLHHATNIFINLADIMKASHGPLVYVWWFFTAFGFAHAGLVMFFVFSGVLVGGPLIRRMRENKPFFRKYLIDRTIRIYIVLVPVLILGAAIDLSGRALFAGRGIYETVFAGHFEPAYLFATLASLQGIWFGAFGTNEPLWSLGMEYWYYICFPLLFLPLSAWHGRGMKIFAFCLGVAIFVALGLSGSYFAFGFWPWLIGVGVRLATKPLIRSKFLALAIWLVPMAIMRLAIPFPLIDQFPVKAAVDTVNALTVANLLLTLRFADTGFRFCALRLHKTMADFSYSLYAIHLPVLVFIWGLCDMFIRPGWRGELATPAHYAVAIGATLTVLAVAWLLSRATEARTDVVRRWAHGLFVPDKKPAEGARPAPVA